MVQRILTIFFPILQPPTPSHSGTFLITDSNQHYIADAPIVRSSNAPLYTQPTINRPTQQDLVVVKYDNGICKPN